MKLNGVGSHPYVMEETSLQDRSHDGEDTLPGSHQVTLLHQWDAELAHFPQSNEMIEAIVEIWSLRHLLNHILQSYLIIIASHYA